MPLKTSPPPQILPQLWKAVSNCSEADLSKIASELATHLHSGDRVSLEGPMGAGKTTFTRFLLLSLGVHQPPEGSPTFAIAHEYPSPRGDIVHIDFYRIKHELEIDNAGIPSYYWERKAIVISEWLSSWPEFESQVLRVEKGCQNCWKISLDFDQPEFESKDPQHRSIQVFKYSNQV